MDIYTYIHNGYRISSSTKPSLSMLPSKQPSHPRAPRSPFIVLDGALYAIGQDKALLMTFGEGRTSLANYELYPLVMSRTIGKPSENGGFPWDFIVFYPLVMSKCSYCK